MPFRHGADPAQTTVRGRLGQVIYLQLKLRDIVNVYAELQTNQRRCLKEYPTWSRLREERIESLQSVARSVKAHEKDCETFKLAGATISLIGDADSAYQALSSALQKDEDKSDAPNTLMKKYTRGHTTGLIGGFITVGATIAEYMIETHKVREVKRILETDQGESSALMEFKSTAEKFKGLIEEIMDFNVFRKVMEGFRTLRPTGRNNRKGWKKTQRVLPSYIVGMIRHLHLHAAARASVEDFTRILYESNDLWDMFLTLVTLNSNDAFVLPAVSLIGESSRDSLHAFNGPLASFSSAYKNAVAWRKNMDGSIPQGIISAAGVVMDVMNIMNAFEKMESPSEFVKYIQQSAKLMQDEMGMWQKIYGLYLRNFD